ncbi:MAG: zinc-ribbon domain-containing protein [Anaeroplasmataceae bacterium]|nr:zinc-ribbon domain-containing protein [Anaeroplasmataceae bacterium]
MKCKFCNAINEEDAVYCIYCGKPLEGKSVCPACGVENELDARFCKECGSKLLKIKPKKAQMEPSSSKEKGLNIAHLVLKIVALCMAGFIILFSFGACFSPFATLLGKGLGMFDFIKEIKKFRPRPAGTYGADFYFISHMLPHVIGLCGVCIALAGCIGAIVYGSIKAILTGIKKQIPNLDKVGIFATCSLLLGMSLVGLFFFYSYSTTSDSFSTSTIRSMNYGAVVSAAVGISIAWFFLNYNAHFVLDLIKGMSKKEIINRAFKLGELIFLIVILFNLGSTFLTFVRIEEGVSGIKSIYTSGMSVVDFFTEISGSIYNKTDDLRFDFSTSSVATGYYIAMVAFILFLIIVVAGISIIYIRMRSADKQKASPITAIPLVGMALVELIITLVAITEFSKTGGVLEMLLGGFENYKTYVGSSIIVFVIFSILLLDLEVAWFIIDKKYQDKKEVNAL